MFMASVLVDSLYIGNFPISKTSGSLLGKQHLGETAGSKEHSIGYPAPTPSGDKLLRD